MKRNYEPPPPPPPLPQAKQTPQREMVSEIFIRALSNAMAASFRDAIAQLPAPVVNIPKPEVKINSPVYVQPPEVKIPATTVNVPEGKAPIVNVEPPAVTLQTNRPTKWHFTFHRDEYGRMTSADVEAR